LASSDCKGVLFVLPAVVLAGCQAFLPEVARQPSVYNPFPQLSKVAVAPFFNLSTEPSVDGREFAAAYYDQLQSVPGFEVVPVGVVEEAMRAYRITLASPADARRLAQLLEVDALVVGSVTDYSPYYPPRCAMQVEWYAANPCFHPIPPGYGLPWGTPEEEQIPPQLVFEAERALARQQLKTQTPRYQAPPWPVPVEPAAPSDDEGQEVTYLAPATDDAGDAGGARAPSRTAAHQAPAWPDPRGLSPSPPFAGVPPCVESEEPVLVHTATYSGADPRVTAALQTYAFFRDDARAGGWQSYLQRSDDFIRFCCHLHIAEMLTARGGAGETRVVWRWPAGR
jgi:hypothetical protein